MPDGFATPRLDRRGFLKAGAAAAGGLMLGIALPSLAARAAAPDAAPTMLTAWLRIAPDDSITVLIPGAEMGQGITTSLPMLIAEELEADWSRMRIDFAPVDPAYNNPRSKSQGTGGSSTIRGFFEPLRQVGAAAREMLRQAAAAQWGVPVAECTAADGRIRHADGRSAGYGALAAAAAALPVPQSVALKPRAEWRLIGQPTPRLDTPAKVDGSARFGIDVRLPDLLFATIAACPVFGGMLQSVDEAPALAVRGVTAVVKLADAVAVVGDGYWPAKKGLAALSPVWDEGALAELDSAGIGRALQAGFADAGAVAQTEGDAAGAFAGAAKVVEAVYTAPYLAHAAMEPVNATARVTADGCEVWAPTQSQSGAKEAVARLLGLPPAQVAIHTTFLGGAFGRKLEVDFILQAVAVAKQVGRPVKLVWAREEDMQHDFYRPVSAVRLRGALDAAGKVSAWDIKVVSPSILARVNPEAIKNGLDPNTVSGIVQSPYAPAALHIESVMRDIGVPLGWWRSVGNSITGFYVEGFIDELAHAAGRDPFAFRRELLAGKPRHRAVLERAAEMAGWDKPAPSGHFRGIALQESFGTIVAEVIEISIGAEGLRVHRVDCALDCGVAVNPSTITAQAESGIVYGLSAALYGEITLKAGRVQQANFDSYPVLQLAQMPKIAVAIIEGSDKPGGMGEPSTPPVAAALANAVFAATGTRLRSLPIARQGIPVA